MSFLKKLFALRESIATWQTFSEQLREARWNNGMSLRELAERTGLSNGYISQLENGKEPPTRRAVELLEQALGTELKHAAAMSVAEAAAEKWTES